MKINFFLKHSSTSPLFYRTAVLSLEAKKNIYFQPSTKFCMNYYTFKINGGVKLNGENKKYDFKRIYNIFIILI